MMLYDEQSSSWQSGYDDFYAWNRDDNFDDDSNELIVSQFANEPAIEDNERDAVSYHKSDHAEYHRGWDHANYENAYTGYRVAAGGLSDS